ncbi:MAG: hypothetical protein F6K19_49995 [Cyanothece sp. SIO1E1]|nr:hypothetical protein [Cyanothece sp. SIO1E1]
MSNTPSALPNGEYITGSNRKFPPKILTNAVDNEVHQALEARYHRDLQHLEKAIENRRLDALKWLTGLMLLFLLVSNCFIGYQLWQQSRQITLIEQKID